MTPAKIFIYNVRRSVYLPPVSIVYHKITKMYTIIFLSPSTGAAKGLIFAENRKNSIAPFLLVCYNNLYIRVVLVFVRRRLR